MTLDFSVKGEPTICKILPLYKFMELELQEASRQLAESQPDISRAFLAASRKATKYIKKALISDYVLLATGK